MRPIRAGVLAALLALAPSGARAEDHVIVQKDRSFSESEVTIHRGDRIVFQNQDTRTHNVFSRTPGFEFEVKAQLPGQTAAIPFPAGGRADVRCAIHPDMKLTVNVKP